MSEKVVEGICQECGAEVPERKFTEKDAEIYGAALRLMQARECRLEQKIDVVIKALTKVLNGVDLK